MFAIVAMLFSVTACDRLQTPEKVDGGDEPKPTIHPPKEPFTVEPGSWGELDEGRRFEIRELPDGRPGLFDSEGALLLQLMPRVILDVTAAGKRRVKPQRKSFRLLRVTPHEGGGFSLFGKFSDQNGKYYDLRVENGGGDPRIHVAVSTKWGRDVAVHRQIIVFRTGAVMKATALHHDYEWREVEGEFINSAHTPNLAEFGTDDRVFTAVGRTGVEGLTVRDVGEGRFDIEFEVYHYENHPLPIGNTCDQDELDGVAIVPKNTKFEVRADFVLGPSRLVLPTRYPAGRRAAVALVEAVDQKARIFAPEEDESAPTLRGDDETFIGELGEVDCGEGRFDALGAKGFEAAWSGVDLPLDGANALAPTEADARRVLGFHHPQAMIEPDHPFVLFNTAAVEPNRAAQWFAEKSLAELKSGWGATVARTSIETLLARNASATKTVRDSLTSASAGTVWIAGVRELAQRLDAMQNVEIDYLPRGVLRVRNTELVDLPGFTLLLPPGVTAKYSEGEVYTSSGRTTHFDLGGRQEQLLQLFEGDEPFWPMRPATVEVSFENRPAPTEESPE
jgi:hypothetical protein